MIVKLSCAAGRAEESINSLQLARWTGTGYLDLTRSYASFTIAYSRKLYLYCASYFIGTTLYIAVIKYIRQSLFRLGLKK